MTDRELLELAAKAAGLSWHDNTDGYGELPHLYLLPPDEENRMQRWNPLADDGDALRLAVKLDMLTDANSRCGWCEVIVAGSSTSEEYSTDPLAAMRRAIVRAAAEIGRSQ